MKRLLALAALLLASSAAQAQYTFQYGGRTIHIDPDRGTVSIPGVYDNNKGHKSKRARSTDQDTPHRQQQVPQDAKIEPQAPATPAPADAANAPAQQATAPAAPITPVSPDATAAAPPPPAQPTTTANAPADTAPLPPPPAEPPAPAVAAVPPPAPQPPPQPAPAPAPQQTATAASAPAPAAAHDPNSPIGVWLTEEKEGKVRIEQCGGNLCGYSVDAKSNHNGEQVLINMKPGRDLKWSGRILDPNTGSTYDSTISLKGADTLRVQGCAFGGMFCGGQTWTRVD